MNALMYPYVFISYTEEGDVINNNILVYFFLPSIYLAGVRLLFQFSQTSFVI